MNHSNDRGFQDLDRLFIQSNLLICAYRKQKKCDSTVAFFLFAVLFHLRQFATRQFTTFHSLLEIAKIRQLLRCSSPPRKVRVLYPSLICDLIGRIFFVRCFLIVTICHAFQHNVIYR